MAANQSDLPDWIGEGQVLVQSGSRFHDYPTATPANHDGRSRCRRCACFIGLGVAIAAVVVGVMLGITEESPQQLYDDARGFLKGMGGGGGNIRGDGSVQEPSSSGGGGSSSGGAGGNDNSSSGGTDASQQQSSSGGGGGGGGQNSELTITSPAFDDGGPCPIQYTSEGSNISPPLRFSSTPPPGTQSLVLIMTDPQGRDGQGKTHWLVANIPAASSGLEEGIPPNASGREFYQILNDDDIAGYTGPKPPHGSGEHKYVFKLFAFDGTVSLSDPSTATNEDLDQQLADLDALGKGTLMCTYSAGGGNGDDTSSISGGGDSSQQQSSSGGGGDTELTITSINGGTDSSQQQSSSGGGGGGGQNSELTITSPAFDDGGPCPIQYTADGSNASPPLRFSSTPPPGTQSLVLIMTDPQGRGDQGYVHWLVANIPAASSGLEEGIPPNASGREFYQILNDGDIAGYTGPKPPHGSGEHKYIFKLFAFDGTVSLSDPSTATKDDLDQQLADLNYLGKGTLMCTYGGA